MKTEVAVGATCLGILLWSLRALLFAGDRILPHDNYYWCYPIFHYFAENLTQGRFVLWNPYVHGGEPFYPLAAQLRLWDPFSMAMIWLVSRFTRNTVLWFNWWHLLHALLFSSGIYALYRPLVDGAKRIFLIPILLFSAVMLTPFAQNAFLLSTVWVPWQAFFVMRLVHGRGPRPANWLLLALTIGVNWQSYFFAPTWVYLGFGAAALAAFRRHDLKRLARGPRLPIMAAALVVLLLALPNAALLVAAKGLVFPLRMAPPNYAALLAGGAPVTIEGDPSFSSFGTRMPYDFVRYTGGAATWWDYLQMFVPTGNWILHGDDARTWGAPSESYLYIGLLPLLLGLHGIFFGRHRLRRPMVALWAALVLLTLGSAGMLHAALYPIFPPLWFVRNAGLFSMLVLITFLYFVCLGLNRLPRLSPVIFAVFALDLLFSLYNADFLRRGEPAPGAEMGVENVAHAPRFPEARRIAPLYPRYRLRQDIRYLPLLRHLPYAFSAGDPPTSRETFFHEARRGRRWNSFLLEKSYFALVHSDLSDEALAAAFAIDRPLLDAGSDATYSVRAYDYDSLVVDVSAPTARRLTWSDGWDADWVATVDGRRVNVADGAFKAVAIPAGPSRVTFRFRPTAFLAALAVFYLTIAAALVAALRCLARRASARSSASTASGSGRLPAWHTPATSSRY